MTENPTLDRLTSALTEPGARAVARIILQDITDADLVATYQKTDGAPGNPFADLICIEAERRGLDL